MSDNRKFILISSASRDRASFDIEFRNEQERGEGFMCKACRTVKPLPITLGTIIVQGVIDDAPFGVIDAGLGLARREFLYSLGDKIIERYFYTGDVINYKGKRLDNWVAYRPKASLYSEGRY